MSDKQILESAFNFIKNKEFKLAIETIKNSSINKPLKGDELHLIAIAESELNNLSEAEFYFDSGENLNEKNPYFYLNYGITLNKNNKFLKAIEKLLKAKEIKNNFHEASFNIGNSYKGLRNFQLAIDNYISATSDSSLISFSNNNIGICYFELQEYEKSISYFNDAIKINNHYFEAFCNKGNSLLSMNEIDEAIKQYNYALKINPNYALAFANKGFALQKLGQIEASIQNYEKALKIEPNLENISIALAALQQSNIPQIAPKSYVQKLFDGYANNFDKDLINNLNYKSYKLLYEQFSSFSTEKNLNILDLGCGTGLCGREFKDNARLLIGVDLSSEMLKKASEKKVYTELIQADICDYMLGDNRKYDVIICADVLVYLGDLNDFFHLINKCLSINGIFLFTIEASKCEAYELKVSQRYGHSIKYIKNLATNNNLIVKKYFETTLRKDKGQDILGYIVTIIKND